MIKGFYTEDRKFIMPYRGFNLYWGFNQEDPGHFMNRWNARFPGQDLKYLRRLIRKGMDDIAKVYKYRPRSIVTFMIISNKSRIKIPVEIDTTNERQYGIAAVITTVLDKEKQKFNKVSDVPVYIQESKQSYLSVPDFDGASSDFHHIFEDGEYWKRFTEIEIDQ
jgi:hypothetical protein